MIGAVLESLDSPLVLHKFSNVSPEAGQVKVRIEVSGLCGAQLLEIQGKKGNAAYVPHLLGHEGFGEVTVVGPGVSKVKAGDKVVLHWRKGSGADAYPPSFQSTTGLRVGAGRVSTICSETLVSENRLTKVSADLAPELGALLGCALTTAFGVVENQLALNLGDSVAVLGAGGLGLSVVSALKLKGCSSIQVVERQLGKEQLARSLGATDFHPSLDRPVNFIVDTIGSSEQVTKAISHLLPGGTLVLLTQESSGSGYLVPNGPLFNESGIAIISSQGGASNPDADIPRLASFLAQNEASWRPLITDTFSLDHVNKGLDCLKSGLAGRVLIQMRG
jgi:Zn-dependent alcohol dehydrogenase